MTPADLPLRLIPKRKPHPLAAAGVVLGCLIITLLIRYFAFGLNPSQGMVSTVFPALMLATLYAGIPWGLSGLVVVFGYIFLMTYRNGGELTASNWISLGVFGVSAAVTVALSGGLRELVIRLDEVRRARDEAEAHQRESEQRFRTLADSAAAIMWVTAPDRQREFVNRAYCEFLGAPFEEALAFDWRERIHPEDLPRILEEQIRGESGDAPFTLEARYRRADGRWRWLQSISRPRRGPNGEFEGFIGIAFDVTQAKQVEADLIGLNELLETKVTAALSERDAAEAALRQSQKLEALGQLTGGVAHDFNNLLTVVIGALDIILRNPHDERRRTRLGEAALAAARRGERLTQQLLAFSRRQPLKPEVLSIDALLAESEPLLRRAVGEGFDLKFDLQAGDVQVRLDGGQFEAAVLNLLINARDATRDMGSIVVCTEAAMLTAASGDAKPGRYVRVTVRDDGEGMTPETLSRAFEPFFTTKPVGRGTGLGLSQVYGFVRQSGGTAEIYSVVGQGTSISLLLPVTEQERVEPGPKQEAEGAYALKVLLVEDDADVGDLVEAMLGELGHHVVRAANVEQGLRLATQEPGLGLMLTDIIMPGGRTGLDLAQEVQRARPDLPIILSSGFTGETLSDAEKAPWPLLRKPYTLDALKGAIAAVIETSPKAA